MTGSLQRWLVCAALACAFAASPKEAAFSDSLSLELGEVSVTAVKSASLYDSDNSFTAIGQAQIKRLNIQAVKNAAPLVPNLYMPDYGSRMTSSIYLRGLGARIDQPAVGLLVDNVPILNKDNYDFDIPDIASVEVLRGPQSTLYGRNTMAGLIAVRTPSPLTRSGVTAMASLALPLMARASATVYIHPDDNLGMALSIYGLHAAGTHRNEFNGSRIPDEDAASLRWKTAWCPSAKFSLENTASLQLNRQNGYPYEYTLTGQIAYNDTCFYKRAAVTDGLSISFSPSPALSLTSLSSFQWLDDNMTLDNDFLPLDYFTLTQKRREWLITQDLILKGTHRAWHWLAGAFFFHRASTTDAPVTFGDYGISALIEANRNKYNPDYPIRWDARSFPLASHFFAPLTGYAIYHQSALELGAFRLAASLRLDIEHPSLSFSNHCNTSYTTYDMTGDQPHVYSHHPVTINQSGHLSHTYTQLLPAGSITWRLPRSGAVTGDLYLNLAKGYKAGGYNTQMFSDVLQQELMSLLGISSLYAVDDILSYKPEWSLNAEIGAHLSIPAAHLSVDAALFHIRCHDQQLTVFPDGNTTGRMMTNAGRTRSMGAELSASWQPTPRLTARAAWGFTDARFRDYDNGLRQLRGKRVPYAPANTLYASLAYTLPLRHHTIRDITFGADCSGVGKIQWDDDNTLSQPFYALLGLNATLRTARFEFELWGTNVTGTRYATFSFRSVGHDFTQRGAGPRAGFTLRLALPASK